MLEDILRILRFINQVLESRSPFVNFFAFMVLGFIGYGYFDYFHIAEKLTALIQYIMSNFPFR